MPHQLEFWIGEQSPSPVPSVWEEFDMEQHAVLIPLLARMINKAVHPQQTDDHEEKGNES